MKKSRSKSILVVLVLAVGLLGICLVACNSGQKDATPQAKEEKASDKQAAEKEVAPEQPAEEKATTAGQPDAKPVPSGPQPKIQFAETVHDWGTVYQEEKVTHIFKFRNTGKGELKIGNVKSG
jgi:cytoskeletal protein RodZ